MPTPGPLTSAWSDLQRLSAGRSSFNLREAFAEDRQRGERFICHAAGLDLDLSRQLLDSELLHSLCKLADQVGLSAAIDSMWAGDPVNTTERRAAWHVMLRHPGGPKSPKIVESVLAERERMLEFAELIRRSGEFDLVVNIGIGGSDLGPRLGVEALAAAGTPRVRFVSNVDGVALHDLLLDANPNRTLFIICSKTFSTHETMSNAALARDWLVGCLGSDAVARHFAAVSTNSRAMDEFGIAEDRRFLFWDWAGGRFSVWSSIGIALAIAIGKDSFLRFLSGAHTMDEHFRCATWSKNLPVLMALVGIWNINFLKIPTLAILPYSDRLSKFPSFLQQLEMESNGKTVLHDGSPALCETAPIVWGASGNDGQHSFYQLLHQGVLLAALDFILLERSPVGLARQQQFANVHALAQIEAFAIGEGEVIGHRFHHGARPQSLIVIDELIPERLGALMAAYEHKVYAQSVVWGINAFDQFGVELGKRHCMQMLHSLDSATVSDETTVARWLRREISE